MSVSLLELMEQAGFHPTRDYEDAEWLLSKQAEFEELIEESEAVVEEE